MNFDTPSDILEEMNALDAAIAANDALIKGITTADAMQKAWLERLALLNRGHNIQIVMIKDLFHRYVAARNMQEPKKAAAIADTLALILNSTVETD